MTLFSYCPSSFYFLTMLYLESWSVIELYKKGTLVPTVFKDNSSPSLSRYQVPAKRVAQKVHTVGTEFHTNYL